MWRWSVVWHSRTFSINSHCKTNIISKKIKSFAICSRWFDVPFMCILRWSMWCFCSSENFSLILAVCLIFFSFSCCKKVENATCCRRFRSRSDLKMMSFFSFVYFILCEFSSWWVAKSCLSIVICVHLFECSKTCSTLQLRIENALTQLILTFCLTCLTVRLIYTMMISCNFFCLTFAAL